VKYSKTGVVRKRRSWYRRRLRIQRTLLAVAVSTVLVAVCWQHAAHYFSLPSVRVSQVLPNSFWTRPNLRSRTSQPSANPVKSARLLQRIPGVYPYSVVPGGVKGADGLRDAVLHDYVVRRHYAHFDFDHAHLVRASQAREVYLSYRIRDSVFWTHKRIRLQPGEMLLTDGKITARARCGNQISDTAKPEVSDEEPEESVLDEPVARLDSEPAMPMRPLPAPYAPTQSTLFTGTFYFPYVPIVLPMPGGACRPNDHIVDGKCVHKHKPVVPEPSTWLLLGSGLALIAWRYRNVARPTVA
jgi:PEP-CTERM motif